MEAALGTFFAIPVGHPQIRMGTHWYCTRRYDCEGVGLVARWRGFATCARRMVSDQVIA